MKQQLLNLIICPFCKSKFNLKTFLKQEQEIIHGLLKCKCREYPIINGVPRIMPDSFRGELINNHRKFFSKYKIKNYQLKTKTKRDQEKILTTKRFSYEWKKFSHLHQEYEKQFLDWVKVPKEFFQNKIILDAGCGKGRHSNYAAQYGAKQVIGIDLGESIEVAYQNNKEKNNADFIQADIYNLPFKEETFDYAYSIGVLHHLPNPEQGFSKIVPKIKKNGHFSIWVYGKEGNGLLKVMDPIRKYFISKLPLRIVDAMSLAIILPLYPIFKIYKIINQSKNFNLISKILPQNHFFYYLSKLNLRICHCILFDQLLAPTAFYHTKKDIHSWFVNAGFNEFKITPRNNNSWRGFGEK
ncbi:MAG: methyltransferase domain-containing protein [Nanoarchaeota archaeon]|nr:methyltransferase domain-containing protein [Nanoarchaeota archaeon]MBU1622434.1 methyltransferase domain-containing protein [Nanoarchaeota archaeon]MBU1974182.1 methyltransferase domain-containing protein [Nanoarchaeota archaeon]